MRTLKPAAEDQTELRSRLDRDAIRMGAYARIGWARCVSIRHSRRPHPERRPIPAAATVSTHALVRAQRAWAWSSRARPLEGQQHSAVANCGIDLGHGALVLGIARRSAWRPFG